MLKKLVLSLSLLISTAFANADRVGDYAIFAFLSNGVQGVQAQVFNSYDRNSDSFEMQTIVEVNGQRTSSSERIAANQIMTKELANAYLTQCEEIGGKREIIKLMDKNWNTCKIPANTFEGQNYLAQLEIEASPEDSGHIWLGEFPIFGFGFIRLENLIMQLGDFHWNE